MKKIRIIVMLRIIMQNSFMWDITIYIYVYILSQSESKRNLYNKVERII